MSSRCTAGPPGEQGRRACGLSCPSPVLPTRAPPAPREPTTARCSPAAPGQLPDPEVSWCPHRKDTAGGCVAEPNLPAEGGNLLQSDPDRLASSGTLGPRAGGSLSAKLAEVILGQRREPRKVLAGGRGGAGCQGRGCPDGVGVLAQGGRKSPPEGPGTQPPGFARPCSSRLRICEVSL